MQEVVANSGYQCSHGPAPLWSLSQDFMGFILRQQMFGGTEYFELSLLISNLPSLAHLS